MPLHDAIALVLAALAGLPLGLVFFGGLWWTVRRGSTSANPAPLYLASLLLRVGVTLLGFHLVGGGHWQRLLACLLGFVLARTIVLRLTHRAAQRRENPVLEADRAPQP